jgi:hypothetical protein
MRQLPERTRLSTTAPILMDLGASANREVCRMASWHLAYHYRRLHPDGAKRGFVRQVQFASADLFLNLIGETERSKYPYAAVLYPRDGASFDDAEARRCLDAVLPASVRGELVSYGMPGDGGAPGVYLFRNTAKSRYSSGALVSFRFHDEAPPIARRGAGRRRADPKDLAGQRWEHVTIIWHGAPDAWNPELLLEHWK